MIDISENYDDIQLSKSKPLAVSKFQNLLSSSTMTTLIIQKGMALLYLKSNERLSITSDWKFNSLQGHWFVKDSYGKDDGLSIVANDDSKMFVE